MAVAVAVAVPAGRPEAPGTGQIVRRRRRRRAPGRRRLAAVLIGIALAADVAVLGAAVAVPAAQPHRQVARAAVHRDVPLTAAQKAARGAADGFQDPTRHAATSSSPPGRPVRVQIPAIDVDAPLQRLTRNRAGVLQPPDNWTDAGWYAAGVTPGAIGPAVIAGHLDTTERAAVFVDLRRLRPGNHVRIRTARGRSFVFVVTHSEVVRKALFPTSAVYGPTPDAELRLITCSEPFDATEGVYADNLVVYAVLKS